MTYGILPSGFHYTANRNYTGVTLVHVYDRRKLKVAYKYCKTQAEVDALLAKY